MSQPQDHAVYRRTSLKRRVGYDQDEGEETPERSLKKMDTGDTHTPKDLQ